VRTLIVASSTFAILLVCFAMYQYSQRDPRTAANVRSPRLPSTPTQPAPPVAGHDTAGVPIGQGVIGAGQNIKISIYPREGTRAQMELSVRDWVPKDGSDHEFLLTNPEVRMRTKDGNAVRVTAREGVMEARRKGASSLDPNRGQLTGDVLIEFDRRGDKDKALLPEEVRDRPEPSDLVIVKTDKLEFDVQYARLSVPGRIQVWARDAELDAEDLEVRFNEAEGRVESLRIARGGRLQLSDSQRAYAFSVPGAGNAPQRRSTLIAWLQATIQASLQPQPARADAPPTPAPPTEDHASGVPVFRTAEEKEGRISPPVRYFARFDGDVDGRHLLADAPHSRLRANSLEILRDFSESDQEKVRASSASPSGDSATDPAAASPPDERIALQWTGRLLVEALSPDDPRLQDFSRARVTARGNPATLLHPEGEARCLDLVYEPDAGLVQLGGTPQAPVVVQSQQGVMSGAAATLQRRGDELDIHIRGPGRLVDETNPDDPAPPSVEFGERMEAHGRFITRTTIGLTGTISSREHRVLDRAVFTGRVRILENETSIEADRLDVRFSQDDGPRSGTGIERLVGRGSVAMVQGDDRITCSEIDVAFSTDNAGRSQPSVATAQGGVLAQQGERTLSASDSLLIDFGSSASPAGPQESESGGRQRAAVRRLRAYGDVSIHDPVQTLDVTAHELDCAVVNRREIEQAAILGTDQTPATARLEALTVTGRRIDLDVPSQSAEVPGAGRLTFLSKKDLDGRPLGQPLPVAVTWSDSMKFRGRENRAVFAGGVHAVSEATTTFDCDRLLIEFQNATAATKSTKPQTNWGILQPFADQAFGKTEESGVRLAGGAFAKEPVYLLADGNAVAETTENDEGSGVLASRARISGARLAVNLRGEDAKMLIESPGNLQLEDFRPPAGPSVSSRGSDLFGVDRETGPSKTLIEWRDRMWYDFNFAQARFEGQVQLKHFSGAELERLFEMSSSFALPPGRSTFLRSDVLTVDFTDRDARTKLGVAPPLSTADLSGRRRGRLSADHLRQFHAAGSVTLQDQVEGLSVTADSIVFEKPRQLLAIAGNRERKATIITQKKGKLPNQISTERLYYNLAIGKLELMQTTVKGQ
jgi:lipopolysaccharide export system protein LptA